MVNLKGRMCEFYWGPLDGEKKLVPDNANIVYHRTVPPVSMTIIWDDRRQSVITQENVHTYTRAVEDSQAFIYEGSHNAQA